MYAQAVGLEAGLTHPEDDRLPALGYSYTLNQYTACIEMRS